VWGPPARDCPSCGAEGIPTGFRFCGACGQALAIGDGDGDGEVPRDGRRDVTGVPIGDPSGRPDE
jgi:hypothetical protein